jgi:hypothetical protein
VLKSRCFFCRVFEKDGVRNVKDEDGPASYFELLASYFYRGAST